jgi:hypothetical protein
MATHLCLRASTIHRLEGKDHSHAFTIVVALYYSHYFIFTIRTEVLYFLAATARLFDVGS